MKLVKILKFSIWFFGAHFSTSGRHRESISNLDVMFLLFYPGGEKRIYRLCKNIEMNGLTVSVISRDIEYYFRHAMLKFSIYALISPYILVFNYIIKTYKPKIICVMSDNLSADIHKFTKKNNTVLCNLAHCPTGESKMFSSLNYDHYFCFGKLSLERLVKLRSKHPHSKCALYSAGSPFWQRSDYKFGIHPYVADSQSPGPNIKDYTIGIVGSYFHSSFEESEKNHYFNYINSLSSFILSKPDWVFLYKEHPIKENSEILSLITSNPNVRLWSDDMVSFAHTIDIAIMTSSAASIECAAFGKPFLIIEWSDNLVSNSNDRNFLRDTCYFDRITEFADLDVVIEERISDGRKHQELLEDYYKLHIAREDSIEFISSKLLGIIDEPHLNKSRDSSF
jgi:hypothetical protein